MTTKKTDLEIGSEKSLLERQADSWSHGTPLSLETLFGLMDEPDTELMLDLLYQEVCRREDSGEHPQAEEYSGRFPELREDIDALYEVHRAMKRDFDMESPEEGASAPDVSYRERYTHSRELGVGGLGRVFLAKDRYLGRNIAIKKLLPQFSQSRHHRERFLREATLTAKLSHPAIVPVYDMGTDEHGELYYSMKFLDGESLDDQATVRGPEFHWKQNRGELRRVINYVLSVCRGVSHAHDKGILHRDIKPANVLVGSQNEVLLVDWGIAGYIQNVALAEPGMETVDEPGGSKTTQQSSSHLAASNEFRPSDRLTVAGMRLGTPAFMSPEQLQDPLAATTQSDVYSLGATLYFCLTGFAPKQDSTHDWGPPKELVSICKKALATDASKRYSSVAFLADDLENWLAGEPVAAYPEGFTKKVVRWCFAHRALVITAVSAAVVAFALSMVFLLQELRVEELRNEKLQQESLADQRLYRSAMIVLATSKELNSHAVFTDGTEDPEKKALRFAIRCHCLEMLADPCPDRQAELHLTIAMCSSRLHDFRFAREHATAALELLETLEVDPDLETLMLDGQLLMAELHLRDGEFQKVIDIVDLAESTRDLAIASRWHYVQGFRLMRGFALAKLERFKAAAEAFASVEDAPPGLKASVSGFPQFAASLGTSLNMPASVFQAGLICRERANLAGMLVAEKMAGWWAVIRLPPMPKMDLERVFFDSPSSLIMELWQIDSLIDAGIGADDAASPNR